MVLKTKNNKTLVSIALLSFISAGCNEAQQSGPLAQPKGQNKQEDESPQCSEEKFIKFGDKNSISLESFMDNQANAFDASIFDAPFQTYWDKDDSLIVVSEPVESSEPEILDLKASFGDLYAQNAFITQNLKTSPDLAHRITRAMNGNILSLQYAPENLIYIHSASPDGVESIELDFQQDISETHLREYVAGYDQIDANTFVLITNQNLRNLATQDPERATINIHVAQRQIDGIWQQTSTQIANPLQVTADTIIIPRAAEVALAQGSKIHIGLHGNQPQGNSEHISQSIVYEYDLNTHEVSAVNGSQRIFEFTIPIAAPGSFSARYSSGSHYDVDSKSFIFAHYLTVKYGDASPLSYISVMRTSMTDLNRNEALLTLVQTFYGSDSGVFEIPHAHSILAHQGEFYISRLRPFIEHSQQEIWQLDFENSKMSHKWISPENLSKSEHSQVQLISKNIENACSPQNIVLITGEHLLGDNFQPAARLHQW